MSTDTDVAYARASRVKVYTVVSAICVPLAVFHLWHNVFLVPVFGVLGLVLGLLIIRNGGSKKLGIALFLLNGAPALAAGIALIALLPNLPKLSLYGISFESD